MKTLKDMCEYCLKLIQPEFAKFENQPSRPETFSFMEAAFNAVIMRAKLNGELEGYYEKLAGMLFYVSSLKVKITPPVDNRSPPSLEFMQTCDTSSFRKDFTAFPEVVACEAAKLDLILVDAVNAAMTSWSAIPADTAEYQDADGRFSVWLKLQPDGTLFAAYPDRDDYTRFNWTNRQFLQFKSLGIKRSTNANG